MVILTCAVCAEQFLVANDHRYVRSLKAVPVCPSCAAQGLEP